MFQPFKERMHHKPRTRRVLNAILTLVTGVLTLILPEFLYLIAGAYLLSLGLMFIAFKLPGPMAGLPLVAGALILIFPDLIPITFASFLGLFGIMTLFALQFAFLGVFMLVTAVLIIMNPDSVAYFIAFFMLVYATSNLISFYREWSGRESEFDDDQVEIE